MQAMTNPTINHGQRILTWLDIEKAEKHYPGSKYVGEFCLKNRSGNWADEVVALFYVQNPNRDLGHTNYFGLFWRDGHVIITNGISATEESFDGIQVGVEIIYSRHRHDMRYDSTGRVFVDGGRDYLRWGGDMQAGKPVKLQIIDGEIKVVG